MLLSIKSKIDETPSIRNMETSLLGIETMSPKLKMVNIFLDWREDKLATFLCFWQRPPSGLKTL